MSNKETIKRMTRQLSQVRAPFGQMENAATVAAGSVARLLDQLRETHEGHR